MHTPDSDSLSAILTRYGDAVSAQMRHVLDAYAEPHEFYGMMRYHLGWVNEQLQPIATPGGKGLRSALLLLVNDGLGGDEAAALPLAAAVELVHNFSLVHDDLEDGSTMRRHRATLWTLWGAPLTINAGDGLYAISHLALFDSPLCHQAPDLFIDVVRRFEHTLLHLCEGQHMDMTFERSADVSVEDYLRMIAAKTAALIAASAWMGARAAGGTDEAAKAAHRFGRELGLAFQMQDDILGIWGDEAVTGKSASTDIVSRKKTLPVLLAMEHAAPVMRERLRELYAQQGDEAGAQEIMDALDETGARDLAQGYLRRHRDAAMHALYEIGLSSQGYARVRAVAGMFIDRSA